MKPSRIAVLALLAFSACESNRENSGDERPDTTRIGPGTRPSVLIPPDTPVSQMEPASDTLKRLPQLPDSQPR